MEESEVAHLYLIDKVSWLRHSHLFKKPILGLELSLGLFNLPGEGSGPLSGSYYLIRPQITMKESNKF